jgi:hypothetical protein
MRKRTRKGWRRLPGVETTEFLCGVAAGMSGLVIAGVVIAWYQIEKWVRS